MRTLGPPGRRLAAVRTASGPLMPAPVLLGWTVAACLVAGSVVFSACDSRPDGRDAAAVVRYDDGAVGRAGEDGATARDGSADDPQPPATGDGAVARDPQDGPQPAGDGAPPTAPGTAHTTPDPAPPAAVPATTVPSPTDPDALAGVLSREVPQAGDGHLSVVPGVVSAPGPGKVRTLKVSVEGGLPVDGQAFASFVLGTLNDPRGWTRDGYAFARSDTRADTEIVLASPQTSEQLCRPLQTMGTLSCRVGDKVVLTWYRWVEGHEDFNGDLTLYRQYLVNHEVGHSLGHGHLACPGAGALAPVMMQQTKGVRPCLPNAWPYP